MDLHRAALALLAFCPALASAQAAQATKAAPHWSVVWAGPIFLGGVILLLLLSLLHRWPLLRGVGVFFWFVVLTVFGCGAIYLMPKAFLSGSWYLPVFLAGIGALVAAGERALHKLQAR
jgi:hypothetical protein